MSTAWVDMDELPGENFAHQGARFTPACSRKVVSMAPEQLHWFTIVVGQITDSGVSRGIVGSRNLFSWFPNDTRAFEGLLDVVSDLIPSRHEAVDLAVQFG